MQKLERKKKYKDNEPEKTVAFITGLLDHYGIKTEEHYHHIDTADINSCRIEIANEGLAELGIGTNGKGMNREYTRASAYGEFMERLANNYLIPGYDTNNDGIIYLRKEAAAPLIKAICREVFGSNEAVSDFYINDYYGEEIMFLAFDDVMSNKKVYLPVSLVGNLTGSNGMCAGNSREEAVIQGISEIFERQVHFDLIFNKITPPEIPREYFADTDVFERLESLDKAGYKPRILDMSLGKGLPVIGLILYHNGKYRVRLGSDPSPITALERCFTEIFQGFDRIDDELFVSFEEQEYERKSFPASDTDFWYKHFNMGITNGNCWFPFNTVAKGIAPDYEFNGFEHPVSISNEDDLNYYIRIIRRNNKKLYISDRGSLGFPVYYTFIPTYSENMIIDDDGRFFVEKSRCSIEKSKLKRVHSLSRNELLSLADDLVKWFDVYSSANNFANSIFRYCSFEPFHKYKVIAYLYACGGNRTKALEYLDRYFETPAGKTDRQLFVRRNVEEGDIHKCFPPDAWPQCPACDRCGIKEHCHLDRIKELNSHIREATGKNITITWFV